MRTALKSDVVGLLGAATLGTVMLSPAMTLYANFGPSFLAIGRAAPAAFVAALIATLPTAISYALLARAHPESGSVSAWMATALSGNTGRWSAAWIGWIAFLYYVTNFIIQPITFGVFLNDLLATLALPAAFWTYGLGVIACCVASAWIAYRGITPSTHGALVFLLIETTVVVALCGTVAVGARAGTAGTVGPTIAATLAGDAPGMLAVIGSHGFFRAMIFGMLAFCGFDVISTLGEETKMPSKLIPQAILLSLVCFGALIVVGIACLSQTTTPERLREVAAAGGMPISAIARQYWGIGAIAVPLTAITAALGIAIATLIGASRILFSMARRGIAPRRFATLHPRYQVPWAAMHVVFGLGLVAALVTGAALGFYGAHVWWCTHTTFFAMVTYAAVNVANLVTFRHQARRSVAAFMAHAVVPTIGLGIDVYILVQSFFIELWQQGWAQGQSIILLDLGGALLAAGLATRSLGRGKT